MPKLEFQFGCFAFAGHVVLKLGRPASPLSQIHLTFLVCLAYFGGFFFSPFWPSPKQSLMDPDHPVFALLAFRMPILKIRLWNPKLHRRGRKESTLGNRQASEMSSLRPVGRRHCPFALLPKLTVSICSAPCNDRLEDSRLTRVVGGELGTLSA